MTLNQDLDDLDRMVDGGAEKDKIRSQIRLIAREAGELQENYASLADAHSKLQDEHSKLQEAHSKLQNPEPEPPKSGPNWGSAPPLKGRMG